MTQGNEPIELTELTPEPKEEGFYLLSDKDSGRIVDCWSHDTDRHFSWSDMESWGTWETMRKESLGWSLQSLAAHDAQIRAEALTLTDKESNKLSEVIWNYVEDEDLDAATGEVKSTLETIAKTRMEQK
jgi:hypothetical protein